MIRQPRGAVFPRVIATAHHPCTGFVCACADLCMAEHSDARVTYYQALTVMDPKQSLAAHKKYLAHPAFRIAEQPGKRCTHCGEMRMMETLPAHHALDLIKAARRVDRATNHVNAWNPMMNTENEILHTGSFFSDLGMWWRPNIPCLRACANTLWREGFTGVSMIIISNLYEICVAQRQAEQKKAIEEERKRAEEERRQKAEEAQQIIRATGAPQGIVIPPIMIPRSVPHEDEDAEETCTIPGHAWIGIPEHVIRQHYDHPAIYSWANARG